MQASSLQNLALHTNTTSAHPSLAYLNYLTSPLRYGIVNDNYRYGNLSLQSQFLLLTMPGGHQVVTLRNNLPSWAAATLQPSSLLWVLFSKFVVIAYCLQSHMELADRALHPPPLTKRLRKFLSAFFSHCAGIEVVAARAATVELIDVSLLGHLVQSVGSTAAVGTSVGRLTNLSVELDAECAALWRQVTRQQAWDAPLGQAEAEWLAAQPRFAPPPVSSEQPPDAPAERHPFCRSCKASSAASAIDTPLFPLHCDALSGALQLDVPHYAEGAEPVRAVQSETQRFHERHHWHSGRPLRFAESSGHLPSLLRQQVADFEERVSRAR